MFAIIFWIAAYLAIGVVLGRWACRAGWFPLEEDNVMLVLAILIWPLILFCAGGFIGIAYLGKLVRGKTNV